MHEISSVHQELNLWKGEIHSIFEVMNTPVEVTTYCHQDKDMIAVEIKSQLLKKGLLKVNLRFLIQPADILIRAATGITRKNISLQ